MADPVTGAGSTEGGRKATSAFSFMHRTDLVLTLLIFIVCGALYYITTDFEEVSLLLSQNIGPEWFPRLLIWFIVVLSVALPFEHLMRKQQAASIDEFYLICPEPSGCSGRAWRSARGACGRRP